MKKIFNSFLAASVFALLLSCDARYSPYVYGPGTASVPVRPSESAEFAQLSQQYSTNKKQRTAQVLTYLLNDPDPAEMYTATVIENNSGCDIIVRFTGTSSTARYNLPIARFSKDQFIIEKGNYSLQSNICGAGYFSQKQVVEPLILKMSAK